MSYTRGLLCREKTPVQSGASGRNRTNDTRIFSPLLYRLSYRGMLGTVRYPVATLMGLEPTISGVTGRRDNRLRYSATKFDPANLITGSDVA